jgi:hypothetical protein
MDSTVAAGRHAPDGYGVVQLAGICHLASLAGTDSDNGGGFRDRQPVDLRHRVYLRHLHVNALMFSDPGRGSEHREYRIVDAQSYMTSVSYVSSGTLVP